MADFPAPSPKPPQLSPGLPLVEKPKCRARGSGKLKAGSSHSSHNSLSHITATTATTTITPSAPPNSMVLSSSSSSSARDVVIKTKFPVARIKRIMQADEDVGKVAQVTPVVVSKALELFMIALCDKASTQARQRNSKRITAGHLKQAIIHEDQFDFLADVIAKVPDIPLPAETTVSNNGESGEDNSNGAPPPKKQRKPRQKKIKDENAF